MPTRPSTFAAIGLAAAALLVPAAAAATLPTTAQPAAGQTTAQPAAQPVAANKELAKRPPHKPTRTPSPTSSQTQTPTPSPTPTPTTSTSTAHFTVNLAGAYAAAHSAGFTVFDVSGSTSNPAGVKTKLDALPSGTQAMIWVGNLGKADGAEGFSRAQFKAQVDALAQDPRVFGYFIADEPHPILFPTVVGEIAARADYVRAVAPTQKSFIVVLDGSKYCNGSLGCEYAALAPSKTHVDVLGVDSYPCHLGAPCDFTKIPERVNAAVKAGVPRSQIAPVYQAFGQEGGTNPYYRTPTATELTTMLSTWKANVPSPVLDYAYTWGTQSSSTQALSNHPELQAVVKVHNNS